MRTSTSILASTYARHALAESSRAKHQSQAFARAWASYTRALTLAVGTIIEEDGRIGIGLPEFANAARAARAAERSMTTNGGRVSERDYALMALISTLPTVPGRINPDDVVLGINSWMERYPRPAPAPAKKGFMARLRGK